MIDALSLTFADAPPAPADVRLMDRDEAEACVRALSTAGATFRALAFDLYHRQGWRALGYDSFAHCVADRLPHLHLSTVYREAKAAQIERQVSPASPVGSIPESVLRPLSAAPPLFRRPAWEAAAAVAPHPTAEQVQDAVDAVLLADDDPPTAPPTTAAPLGRAILAETAAAADRVRAQDEQRPLDRRAARLQRTLHHMTIALKGLRVLSLDRAAGLLLDALEAADPAVAARYRPT